MKKSCILFPLLICLSLFISMTKAHTPTQADFEFLRISLENATMVENGLELAKSHWWRIRINIDQYGHMVGSMQNSRHRLCTGLKASIRRV